MPARGRGRRDLADQLALRQIDHRDGRVFLVLGVEPLPVRRDDQAMAVGRAGLDGIDHGVRRAVDHRHHGAVLAGDVDQAVRPKLERMRRDVGPQVDVADMRALVQIDDAEQMARVRVTAVDAVAEDRHVGKAGLRHHQQFVDGTRKAVEHGLGLVGLRVQEQDLRAHLVDRDQSARALAHREFLRPVPGWLCQDWRWSQARPRRVSPRRRCGKRPSRRPR